MRFFSASLAFRRRGWAKPNGMPFTARAQKRGLRSPYLWKKQRSFDLKPLRDKNFENTQKFRREQGELDEIYKCARTGLRSYGTQKTLVAILPTPPIFFGPPGCSTLRNITKTMYTPSSSYNNFPLKKSCGESFSQVVVQNGGTRSGRGMKFTGNYIMMVYSCDHSGN